MGVVSSQTWNTRFYLFGVQVESVNFGVYWMGCRGWLGFGQPMNNNAKNADDEAGYGVFVVGWTSISVIHKINKAIGYPLELEFAWRNLLMDFIGGSAIKSRVMHDGMVRATVQVADEMFDTLEGWCLWVNRMAWEKVDSVHLIRVVVLHNMENSSNMCTEFS